ncbi:MAG TPA: tetratricopeptide repeat protein [Candidatus Rifleibacterium sp.]|nr:tetratricopeptide repeat protein [Candidatus Rifleibacterium sp.]HPT45379.1 tetratricopeptide repeat protein [Candidatus Rifleibacterium sp.]
MKRIIIPMVLVMFSLMLNVAGAQPIQSTPEYQKAMQSLAQGAYEQAIEELKTLLGNGKFHSPAMVEIGKIRIKQAEAELSNSLAHFSEAADMLNNGINAGGVSGPELPKTLYDLGRIYEERIKNYVMAVDIYNKIIEEHPAFLAIDKVYYNLATCQEAMGMYDQAATNYKKIVTDYGYSTFVPAAQEKMKKLSIGTSAQEGAIAAQANIAADADNTQEVKANMDLGDMQAEAGNFKDAAAAYRKAIQGSTDSDDAISGYRKLIGMLEEKEKDYEGAAKALEEMMQRYPDAQGNEDLVYRLGRIYEEDMDSMKTQVIDGKIRYRKSTENVEKAIDYYNSVTEKFPDADVSADAFLRKGELYEKELKEYDKARASYEEFLRKFPNHSEADNIRQKLQEIEGY